MKDVLIIVAVTWRRSKFVTLSSDSICLRAVFSLTSIDGEYTFGWCKLKPNDASARVAPPTLQMQMVRLFSRSESNGPFTNSSRLFKQRAVWKCFLFRLLWLKAPAQIYSVSVGSPVSRRASLNSHDHSNFGSGLERFPSKIHQPELSLLCFKGVNWTEEYIWRSHCCAHTLDICLLEYKYRLLAPTC